MQKDLEIELRLASETSQIMPKKPICVLHSISVSFTNKVIFRIIRIPHICSINIFESVYKKIERAEEKQEEEKAEKERAKEMRRER